MTPEQKRDPNFKPPLAIALPLGIQHILAMFVSNVTPAIIVAGAAGFGYGSADQSDMVYMIQMSMFFADIATNHWLRSCRGKASDRPRHKFRFHSHYGSSGCWARKRSFGRCYGRWNHRWIISCNPKSLF